MKVDRLDEVGQPCRRRLGGRKRHHLADGVLVAKHAELGDDLGEPLWVIHVDREEALVADGAAQGSCVSGEAAYPYRHPRPLYRSW